MSFFGADMSSSMHTDNKNKDILMLGEGPTKGLDNTSLKVEAMYPINYTQPNKRFLLMEATVSYLLMLQKYISSKQKALK